MVSLNNLLSKLLLAKLTFAEEQVFDPYLDIPLLGGAFEALLQLVHLGLCELARPLIDGRLERVLVGCTPMMSLL